MYASSEIRSPSNINCLSTNKPIINTRFCILSIPAFARTLAGMHAANAGNEMSTSVPVASLKMPIENAIPHYHSCSAITIPPCRILSRHYAGISVCLSINNRGPAKDMRSWTSPRFLQILTQIRQLSPDHDSVCA
ncbi:hypothetical protein Pelo_1840 [Pelomyxa schiedti]|nr:hypothetical protein Pelo_1840 [Pelomyxa schiedti]